MTATYLLDIFLRASRTIKIGRLGTFFFPEGRYIYVGSAKQNFHKRIERHMRRRKKIHWHIDYLLQHAQVTRVWSCNLTEERTAEILSRTMTSPVPRFGSSDKRSRSHLFHGELKQNMTELDLTLVR